LVGGGIYVLASSPTIAHCRIIQNVAVPVGSDNGFGGGVLLVNSNAVIHDSEIAYNSCPAGDAGGLGTTGSANFIILERNVIRNNTALGNGGGLHLRNADATLTNDTVAFNASGTGTGGGVYLYREGAAWKTVDLDNCIIWGNTAGGAGPNIYNDAVSVLLGVTYSDVTGGWGGLGNIAADPLFVDAAAGELHLQAASPCIDTGDPHSPPDPDGSVADMGALPSLSAFVSLGGSLAGSAGAPELTGEGSLVASTPVVLALTKAKPFALSTLVVGVSDLSAAFKGGILVPNTDLLFLLTTDFFGGSTFGGLWPAGVPSSFTTYFQWWVQDQGRPKGFTASNALAGTTP
jgi:hypothetical protein